ncbi:MAG: hypothetical protein DCC75_10460 [Proteobacteria bacterium]|nr:MAG: hypothetical protein DCC75_10460 [Pseudomonadota bacterium]
MILSCTSDLLFSSKIGQTAKQVGRELLNVRSLEDFRKTLLTKQPDLVILDLNSKGLDAFAVLAALKEYIASNYGAVPPRLLCFYSHVDTESADRAKREGVTELYPRSQFTKMLPELLAGGNSQGQAGASGVTITVFLVILGALVFCGYHILPFYYYYFDLENQFDQVIKVASTETDQEIRRKLRYYIEKYEIPAEIEDLKIERDGNRMRISLPYKEIFYITWQGKDYDLHTFEFHAYAEGQF